jgi:hypothetical protein
MGFKKYYNELEEKKIRKGDAKLKKTGIFDVMDPRTTKASNLSINPDDMPESGKPVKMKESTEKVPVDTSMVKSDRLNMAVRFLNKKGYDFRSINELENFFDRVNKSGGVNPQTFPDHYEAAVKFLLPRQKKSMDMNDKVTRQVSRHFGLTNDWREAGYIMPSGALVDFSGKREGAMPNMRSFDHREIGRALENIDHPASQGGTDGMIEFVRMGPIRIDFESGRIHLEKKPTSKQYSALRQFVNLTPSEYITVDVNENEGVPFDGYEKRKVLGYIRRHFAQSS